MGVLCARSARMVRGIDALLRQMCDARATVTSARLNFA